MSSSGKMQISRFKSVDENQALYGKNGTKEGEWEVTVTSVALKTHSVRFGSICGEINSHGIGHVNKNNITVDLEDRMVLTLIYTKLFVGDNKFIKTLFGGGVYTTKTLHMMMHYQLVNQDKNYDSSPSEFPTVSGTHVFGNDDSFSNTSPSVSTRKNNNPTSYAGAVGENTIWKTLNAKVGGGEHRLDNDNAAELATEYNVEMTYDEEIAYLEKDIAIKEDQIVAMKLHISDIKIEALKKKEADRKKEKDEEDDLVRRYRLLKKIKKERKMKSMESQTVQEKSPEWATAESESESDSDSEVESESDVKQESEKSESATEEA